MKNIKYFFTQNMKTLFLIFIPLMLFLTLGHAALACHIGNSNFDIGAAGVTPAADNCTAIVEICYTYSISVFVDVFIPCSKDITITSPGGTTPSPTLTINFGGESVTECLDVPICPGTANAISFSGSGTTVSTVTDNTGGNVDSGLPALDAGFTASETVICTDDTVDLTPNDTRTCQAFSGTGVAGNVFTPPGPGSYTIANTMAGGTACEMTSTIDITVASPPDPAFSFSPSQLLRCGGSVPIMTITIGGIFTGSGAAFVQGNNINPAGADVGATYVLTYTVSSPEGCTDSFTTTFTVIDNCAAEGGSFPTGP